MVAARGGATRPPATNEHYSAQKSAAEGDFLSFDGLLAVLRRQWRPFCLALVAGLALAGILFVAQPKIYKAKASIEVEVPNDEYLDHRQLNPTLGPAAQMMEPYLQTQLRILQSDLLLKRTAEKLNLASLPEFSPKRSWWKKLFPPPGQVQPMTPAEFLDAVRAHVDTRMLNETQIMEASFESEDPKLASDFANGMINAYLALAVNRQVESLNQTGNLLGGQIEDAHRSLEAAERRLQEYVSTSGLLSGGDKDSVAEQRLRQMQGALTAAQDGRITEEARYRAALDHQGQLAPDALESETLRAYRVRLTELRQQVAQASEVLQPAHYKVRELQAQLNEVEKAYQREHQATLGRLKSQYEASVARERALLKDYNQQVGQASAQMTNSVRYSSLKRDVETQQQIYDSLVQRTKEASVMAAMRTSNARIMDVAQVPYAPVRPQKALYGAVGLSLGTVSGLLLAFQRDRRERQGVYRDSAMPLGLRSLGVLPHFERASVTEEPELAAWTSPDSEFARVLEGATHFLFPRGQRPGVVGVTSPNNGEGKTTAACNLAIEMARSGRSVLLIDADHCTPKLHEVFAIDNEVGFTDLVKAGRGAAESTPLVSAWVTKIPNLAVLPCGTGRLPAGCDYAPAIKALRSEFDAVIIDLPAVQAADSAVGIAKCTDRVALMISSEYTTQQGAEVAIRRLILERVPLTGALFNRVTRSPLSQRLTASSTHI